MGEAWRRRVCLKKKFGQRKKIFFFGGGQGEKENGCGKEKRKKERILWQKEHKEKGGATVGNK